MARHQLSSGSLLEISQGAQGIWQAWQPVVQLLHCKDSAPNIPRFRVLISDGVNSSHGMLATHLNEYIYENKLHQFCIFKVKSFHYDYVVGHSKAKRLIKGMMILDLEILQA
jgi:hypothetical protein